MLYTRNGIIIIFLYLVFFYPFVSGVSAQEVEKIILVRNQSRSLEDFRTYAKLAAQLKPYGQVQMEISALADKSWYEIPEGGSPWHEYACYISTPWKFFPHPDIAAHLPMDWVAANRRLMLEKAKIVQEYGLVPLVYAKSTHFLPESFFKEHPELRGPRVDHPRRSKREEFAWCTDLPETRAYISWMITEMKKNIPDLATIVTGFNDSGSGLCWASAQYSGPNGPDHCRDIPTSERVRVLCETIHQAARDGGGDIVLRFGNANFWYHETETVLANLPENTYFNDEDPALALTGTQINRQYPFLGLVDPLEILSEIIKLNQPQVNTILLRFTDQYYGRADESPEAVVKFLEVFEAGFNESLVTLQQKLNKLSDLSTKWGGDKNKDAVFEAFFKMHSGLEKIKAIAPRYYRHPLFLRVSLRYLTRPLVIKPELLTKEEESYFLPFVFNVYEDEARTDYIDIHGSRMNGTPYWQHQAFQKGLNDLLWAANTLDNLNDAPEANWFKNVAFSLKMYVSFVRSIDNFYHAQLIRDRHKEALAGEPTKPSKSYSRTGDPDYIPFNNIQRDEFDNAYELINLLENGGLQYVVKAKDSGYEDPFLLGPEFLSQVKMKVKLMREHWTDVQDYLQSPMK